MEKQEATHIATVCRLEKVMTPSEEKLVVLIPVEIAEGRIDKCKNFVMADGTKCLSVEEALERDEQLGYNQAVSFDSMLGHGLEVLTVYLSRDYSDSKEKSCKKIIEDCKKEYEDELKKGIWYFDATDLFMVKAYDENVDFYERYGISLNRELGAITCDQPDEAPEDDEEDEIHEEIPEETIEKPTKKIGNEPLSLKVLKLKTTRLELIEETKKRVIAQDFAVERVASAIYNPIRLGINAIKQNILLYGPSGSGKSYLIRTIAKLLGLPYFEVNFAELSETGYVGDSIGDIYTGLFLAAGKDTKKLEKGAILIAHEVDKLMGAGNVKQAVYNEALRLWEPGGIVNFKPSQYSETISYDKSNLFIVSNGTFANMLNQSVKCGFGAESKKADVLSKTYQFTPDDFIQKGYPPEFMNRQQLCIPMRGLLEEDYYRILTESADSTYVQTRDSLKTERGINLKITDSALRQLSSTAFRMNKGARAIQNVFIECINPELDAISDGIDSGNFVSGDFEIPDEAIVKRLGEYNARYNKK